MPAVLWGASPGSSCIIRGPVCPQRLCPPVWQVPWSSITSTRGLDAPRVHLGRQKPLRQEGLCQALRLRVRLKRARPLAALRTHLFPAPERRPLRRLETERQGRGRGEADNRERRGT